MNSQQYLDQLMQQSKYCACPSLTDLFEKRRTAQTLEAKCNFFRKEGDVDNPLPIDEAFMRDYQRKAQELEQATQAYHTSLYQHAKESKVYFQLHEPRIESKPRKMSLGQAEPFLKKRNEIISIHCGECDQQIDVAAESV